MNAEEKADRSRNACIFEERVAPFRTTLRRFLFVSPLRRDSAYLRLSAPQGCGYPISCVSRVSRDKNREEEGRKEWKRRTNGKNDDRMRNEAVRETCQRVKKNPLSEKETVGLSARNCARR